MYMNDSCFKITFPSKTCDTAYSIQHSHRWYTYLLMYHTATSNSNMSLVWNPSKKHSERERWVCIYPIYLNSKRSLKGGRKLTKDKCVENPTHQEIRDVLVAVGFNVGVENKLHPKERSKEPLYRGRIRVQLKNDDGTPIRSEFPTRDSLLAYVGTTIPKLKTRQGKQSSSEQASQSSSSTSKKGKGKGRR